jgi:hypothetical protein
LNRDQAPQFPTPIKLETDYKEADLLTVKIQRGANKKVTYVAKAGSTESSYFNGDAWPKPQPQPQPQLPPPPKK